VLAEQARQDGQQKRGSFARTRLRTSNQVTALQGVRQNGTLNRCGLAKSALLERVEQVGIGDESVERYRGRVERGGLAGRTRQDDGLCARPASPGGPPAPSAGARGRRSGFSRQNEKSARPERDDA